MSHSNNSQEKSKQNAETSLNATTLCAFKYKQKNTYIVKYRVLEIYRTTIFAKWYTRTSNAWQFYCKSFDLWSLLFCATIGFV